MADAERGAAGAGAARRRSRSRSRSRSPRREARRSASPSRRRRHDSRSPPRRKRSRSRSPRKHRSRSPRRRRSRSRSRERRSRPDRSSERHRDGTAPSLPPPPPGGPPGERGWQTHSAPVPPPPPPLPALGSIHRATVEGVRPFGVFVSLPGFPRHGLVHANAVSADMRFARDDPDEAKVQALDWAAPRGSQVWVKVTEISDDPSGRGGIRIGCAMTAVDQESGADLDPTGAMMLSRGAPGGGGPGGAHGAPLSEEPPAVNSIHHATVADIRPFGLFVRLDGFRKNGLVHTSQVSEHMGFTREDPDEEKVAALAGVVSVGERIWVKVVEVEAGPSGPKIACSMKLVNQSSGADLDPAGTRYRPRGAMGGRGGDDDGQFGRNAAAAVRAGVIDWGHHAAGVRSAGAGGPTYELVPSDDEGVAPPPPPPPEPDRMVTHAGAMARIGAGAPPPGMLPDLVDEASPAIGSVEEALAVLERYKRKAAKRESKKDKKKRDKKEKKRAKKEAAKRAKGDKKSSKRDASASSSSSSSSSSGS